MERYKYSRNKALYNVNSKITEDSAYFVGKVYVYMGEFRELWVSKGTDYYKSILGVEEESLKDNKSKEKGTILYSTRGKRKDPLNLHDKVFSTDYLKERGLFKELLINYKKILIFYCVEDRSFIQLEVAFNEVLPWLRDDINYTFISNFTNTVYLQSTIKGETNVEITKEKLYKKLFRKNRDFSHASHKIKNYWRTQESVNIELLKDKIVNYGHFGTNRDKILNRYYSGLDIQTISALVFADITGTKGSVALDKGAADGIYKRIETYYPSFIAEPKSTLGEIKKIVTKLENGAVINPRNNKNYWEYETKEETLLWYMIRRLRSTKDIRKKHKQIRGQVENRNIVQNTEDLLKSIEQSFKDKNERIIISQDFRADILYKFNKSSYKEIKELIKQWDESNRIKERHLFYLELLSDKGEIIYKFKRSPKNNMTYFILKQL